MHKSRFSILKWKNQDSSWSVRGYRHLKENVAWVSTSTEVTRALELRVLSEDTGYDAMAEADTGPGQSHLGEITAAP